MLAMKKPVLALLALLTTALASGCTVTGADTVEVREFLLYGQGGAPFNERQAVFFGDTDAAIEFKLGGLVLKLAKPLPAQLTAQSISVVPAEARLNVAGSLWVNGQPSLVMPLRGIADRFTLSAVPVSDDVVLETRTGLEAVAYYNGRSWFTVAGPVNGERKLRYSPRQRDGLRGLGDLSEREADGLAAYLTSKANGPVAVALIAPGSLSHGHEATSAWPWPYNLACQPTFLETLPNHSSRTKPSPAVPLPPTMKIPPCCALTKSKATLIKPGTSSMAISCRFLQRQN
jgi:hypothetical protein